MTVVEKSFNSGELRRRQAVNYGGQMKMRKLSWIAAALALVVPFKAASAETAAPAGSPQYVGAETCIACHQEHGAEIAKTIHGKVKDFELAVKEAKGCEGCHGPGSLHVEAAGDKADPKF
ncbi:MAG: hypothetical protein Q7R35_16180, partial [Elusimicrobiota bacterium]|nr:hypothetical protein [Elusimicrobiota bacterium]